MNLCENYVTYDDVDVSATYIKHEIEKLTMLHLRYSLSVKKKVNIFQFELPYYHRNRNNNNKFLHAYVSEQMHPQI